MSASSILLIAIWKGTRLGHHTDLVYVEVGPGVVVPLPVGHQDVGGSHGGPDIIDNVAGVSARVLYVRVPEYKGSDLDSGTPGNSPYFEAAVTRHVNIGH